MLHVHFQPTCTVYVRFLNEVIHSENLEDCKTGCECAFEAVDAFEDEELTGLSPSFIAHLKYTNLYYYNNEYILLK